MQGDGVVLLVVCLSLLGGIVVGLRFNVRMLALICLAVLVTVAGLGLIGVVGAGRGALSGAVSVLALQVGYFISMLIAAMRLTEEPIGLAPDVGDVRPKGARASRG